MARIEYFSWPWHKHSLLFYSFDDKHLLYILYRYISMPIIKSLTQTYLGCEHVIYTIDGTMKSEASDQVDKEDHIWKCCSEVHHLQMEQNSKIQTSNKAMNAL